MISQDAANELLEKCRKVEAWLNRLADRAESEARDTRFPTMRVAWTSDAKNYRATAKDIRKAINKAENG